MNAKLMQPITLLPLLLLSLLTLNGCQNAAEPEVESEPSLEQQAEEAPAVDQIRDQVQEDIEQSEKNLEDAESEVLNPSQSE